MSIINILLQNPQYYGILRKPHTDGEFEVYRGFVWVNVGGALLSPPCKGGFGSKKGEGEREK